MPHILPLPRSPHPPESIRYLADGLNWLARQIKRRRADAEHFRGQGDARREKKARRAIQRREKQVKRLLRRLHKERRGRRG